MAHVIGSDGWSAALDAQTALIGTYFSRTGREHLEALAVDEADCSDDPAIGTVNRQRYLVAAAEGLRQAETIYVSDEVGALLKAAAPTFRPEPLHASDFFTPRGFVLFADPFFETRLGEYFARLQAAQWALDAEGVALAFYAVAAAPLAGSWLTLESAWRIPFGGAPSSQSDPTRYLAAFLRFAQQRIAVTHREQATRPARRRARAWRAVPDVVVATLRRSETGPERGGEVEWSHRWMVNGHWRNQWYPTLGIHRQRWVGPYVKGPHEKPFIPKRRVFEAVR